MAPFPVRRRARTWPLSSIVVCRIAPPAQRRRQGEGRRCFVAPLLGGPGRKDGLTTTVVIWETGIHFRVQLPVYVGTPFRGSGDNRISVLESLGVSHGVSPKAKLRLPWLGFPLKRQATHRTSL